jgi:hypothetical protein
MVRLKRLARLLLTDRAAARDDLRVAGRLLVLRWNNRVSSRPVTGSCELDVNLTSYGPRIAMVHLTLESIAAGAERPRRLILWLDDEAALADLPRPLRRLQRRGLEIRQCENYGPHKKQYPYARDLADGRTHLVTADDDMLYPRTWLAGLATAVRSAPDLVHGYRAYRVAVDGDRIAPYGSWQLASDDRASFANFCTGVSGVVYPPRVLEALRDRGEEFRDVAPTADDVWAHATAVSAGVRSRQVETRARHFLTIPRSQVVSLFRTNVVDGANDLQIARSYGPDDVARVVADARSLAADPAGTPSPGSSR